MLSTASFTPRSLPQTQQPGILFLFRVFYPVLFQKQLFHKEEWEFGYNFRRHHPNGWPKLLNLRE